MIDFETPKEAAHFAAHTRSFARDIVMLAESRKLTEELRAELQKAAWIAATG